MIRAFIVAVRFLTVLPVPGAHAAPWANTHPSVGAYPAVGLLLGLLLASAWLLLAALPPAIAALLLIAVWVGMTGALHLDGLSDTADAAFAARSPAERRAIARDPHVGTFALATVVLAVALRVAAVSEVPPSREGVAWLLVAPLIARSVVVIPMAAHRIHDDSKLARAARPTPCAAGSTAVVGCGAALILGGLLIGAAPILAAVSAAMIVSLGVAAWIVRRLNGLGGDAYGAIIELVELAVLLIAATTSG